MPRSVTASQYSNATADQTWPILLVQLEHSSPIEYLSCTSTVTYDGQSYSPGANIKRLNNRTATIEIRQTTLRADEIENGLWRGGICKVYYIPALPSDTPTFTASQGILMLDGIIDTSTLQSDVIEISVNHKYLQGVMTPALHLSSIANHMPVPGSVTEWEGEKLTNKPPRNSILMPRMNVGVRISYG